MAIIEADTLNSFTVLDLVIDSVVQIVLLIFFFGITLAFLKGIKDVSILNVVLTALIYLKVHLLAITKVVPSLCDSCWFAIGRCIT